jgi:thioester reductase-like protein
MATRRGVFLTGATGLVGQYLLHDLLGSAYPVTVLVRDSPQERADLRIAQIVAQWSDRLGRQMPAPTVLGGDLRQAGLGLSAADRRWLQRHCRTVIHAASLSFRTTADGEPWRTNVEGTRSLLGLCKDIGLSQLHHVSTAFVCGRQSGIIVEDNLDTSHGFHNAYEESKFQAERLLRRQARRLQVTFHRPAVIVGDSRTGHTASYNGLYRFLELAARLASPHASEGRLPLRLPLTGHEAWNLVSVDWVSQAIVALLDKPHWHGHTFHLVSRAPVTTRLLRDVAAEVLGLSGVEFAGPGGVGNPSLLEQLFFDGIREYWPCLSGSPVFACANTRMALPGLPPPVMDRETLQRLIRFAVSERWGRGTRAEVLSSQPRWTCAEYMDRVFPDQARRSNLAREAGLDLTVAIDVRGDEGEGGQWSCKWQGGELAYLRRGLDAGAAVTYHTDASTFQAVVSGLLTPQEAFFEERIAITGDLETALKLAVLFGQFLLEQPAPEDHRKEVMDSTSRQF